MPDIARRTDNDEMFDKFAIFYERCPICGLPNHREYLREFYFSFTKEAFFIKNKLLEIMNRAESFSEKDNVKIGIPCCKCFNNVFNVKISINNDYTRLFIEELKEIFNRRMDTGTRKQ